MSDEIAEILYGLATGHPSTPGQHIVLASWMLEETAGSNAFGVTSANIDQVITLRSQLLPQVYPRVQQFWQHSCRVQTPMLKTLWMLWLPLVADLISAYQTLGRPLIQGFLGGQGSGKTTLTKVLGLILDQLGYSSLSFSLDDLYKPYEDRQLLQKQDPRLIWRGPPGTHDVTLGVQILDQLRRADSDTIALPRFDKSAYDGQGDRAGFEQVSPVDIVLFEGWFVGVRPIDPVHFEQPLSPIDSAEDQQFARDMNCRLNDYLPLWDRLDALIVLDLVDYRLSKQWRREAEQKAIAAGKGGMSDAEVDQFVDYFWKALHPDLFVKPLIQNSQWVNLVIKINANHAVDKVC